ncbi:MAG: flagellar protein FlgN [Firmicutes bacterium]|nr:flagellar protein FlgN [Bacillota bacterium]
MEPLFFELTEVLKQQKEVVKEMLTTAETQNEALRNVDVEALNDALKQLTIQTQQMAKLDPEREELQRKLENELGLNPGASVKEMLEKAPVDIKIELKQVQMELRKDFNKLQELNQLNKLLTKKAIQINSSIMKMYNPNDSQTYQGSGEVKSKDQSTKMLNKTV